MLVSLACLLCMPRMGDRQHDMQPCLYRLTWAFAVERVLHGCSKHCRNFKLSSATTASCCMALRRLRKVGKYEDLVCSKTATTCNTSAGHHQDLTRHSQLWHAHKGTNVCHISSSLKERRHMCTVTALQSCSWLQLTYVCHPADL